ncbi:MAG: hypothetical protein JWQ07_3881 [Ramlibacter sp.]|nr:hypothetical protein [Ramlibacter sp.]
MLPSQALPATAGLSVRVVERRAVAEGVIAIELRAESGRQLPRFSAGSHIDVELPVRDGDGRRLVRQYSLCNDPAEDYRYVIGVGRDANTRGGSAWLHESLQCGDLLDIGAPRNHFQLHEAATHSVLVAGGIGITPLAAMARRLSALGRRWTLYYCARTPERAAFLDELRLLPGLVVPVFDGLPGVAPVDLARVVADAPAGAHLYCCGPPSLMRAFEAAAVHRDAGTVHVEWFEPRPAIENSNAERGADRAFTLTLARSGNTLTVPPGKSILDVLIEAGIDVQHSCCDGVCGTCETRVLEGSPEHRDSVLLGEKANATDRMMICVSRCAGAALTLDL